MTVKQYSDNTIDRTELVKAILASYGLTLKEFERYVRKDESK